MITETMLMAMYAAIDARPNYSPSEKIKAKSFLDYAAEEANRAEELSRPGHYKNTERGTNQFGTRHEDTGSDAATGRIQY